jgi:hypothetical protein
MCILRSLSSHKETNIVTTRHKRIVLFTVFCYELLAYPVIWEKTNEIAKDVSV